MQRYQNKQSFVRSQKMYQYRPTDIQQRILSWGLMICSFVLLLLLITLDKYITNTSVVGVTSNYDWSTIKTCTSNSQSIFGCRRRRCVTNHRSNEQQQQQNVKNHENDYSRTRRFSSKSLQFLSTSSLSSSLSTITMANRGNIYSNDVVGVGDEQQQQQQSNMIVRSASSNKINNINNSNSFWPPWPFNLLQQSQRYNSNSENDEGNVNLEYHQSSYQKRIFIKLLRFTKTSTKVGIRTIQEFGSQLWFHSPPAIPPLVLYALWPYRTRMITQASSDITSVLSSSTTSNDVLYKTIVPLFMNGWVRNIVLFTTGLAIISWAHEEIHRNRKLTPLPLLYHDLIRAELPPFLPEQVSTISLFPILPTNTNTSVLSSSSASILSTTSEDVQEDGETGSSAVVLPSSSSTLSDAVEIKDDLVTDVGIMAHLSPRLRRHWMQIRNIKAPSSPQSPISMLRFRIKEWQKIRQLNIAERKNAHRLAIYEELVTLQQAITRNKHSNKDDASSTATNRQHNEGLKNHRKMIREWNPFGRYTSSNRGDQTMSDNIHNNNSTTALGYALVTGASQGIGRAIAVELARWHIPLILVARDINALSNLAYDIQTCYGVDCNVLSADLSRTNAAEQIYKTVTDAGLQVDILVNNAGISSHGETLNMSLEDVQRMIQVNTISVATLTHLFGRDMKERRRGRILLVSSICGAVNGIATVAVYAATKAFENSFGSAIGKELEPYGVGVTCLIPGAVKGTEFRSRSNAYEALCWKIPFYSKTPPAVAECGVRALLCGDTEVTPGVLNRFFLKVLKPILPQRMHNLLAEIMWNPLQLTFRHRRNTASQDAEKIEILHHVTSNSSSLPNVPSQRSIIVRPQLYSSNQPLPRILTLEEAPDDETTYIDPQIESNEPSSEQTAVETSESIGPDVNILRNNTEYNKPETEGSEEPLESKETTSNPLNAPQSMEHQSYEKRKVLPPPTSSELDLLLDQYKRLRSISTTDPWSIDGYNDRYIDSHMLPSVKDVVKVFEVEEI